MVFCGPDRRIRPVSLALPALSAAPTAPGGDTAVFVAVCVACGVVAAVAMDVPMARQTDGFAPAYVAASVLARSRPDAVGLPAAVAVHHVAGAAAGLLYAVVYLTTAVLPGGPAVGGVAAVPHALATLAVAGFVYAFFAHLVLPRRGRRFYEERATAVRGGWLRSVIVFGVAVAIAVPVATGVA